MKIFLDANILVAVLNKEYPAFSYAARILSLTDYPGYKIVTSPLCLAIAYYFAEKKSGKKKVKEKLKLLVSKIGITKMGSETVISSLQNKKVHDFEDGMEYYSALSDGCDVLVTENVKDFYFSAIDVVSASGFFEKIINSSR